MATAVMQKTKEQTGTWSKIFPTEQLTETQSSLFVKKLLAVAVSNIAYLRAIFPEDSFGDRSLEGLNLKILREDIACPGACQVIKWVKGCFDAFDKKYLKMIMIGLYVDPNDPDTVIESYSFKFTYTQDGEGGMDIYRNNEKISGAHSESETRKSTVRLLRTIIILTQNLESLPDNVMMTMKLLYYDDVTPADYEPPGFKSAENDNFAFEDEPMTIKVGDVATPYHCVKVRVKTDRKQFETKDDEKGVEEEMSTVDNDGDKEIPGGLDTDVNMQSTHMPGPGGDASVSQDGDQPTPKAGNQGQIEPLQDACIPTETPDKPGTDDNAVDTVGSEASQTTDAGDDYQVRCPCGCNEDDGLMIMCAVCKFWQHGVCFLVIDEDDAPERHICDVCAVVGDGDRYPTDLHLVDQSSIAVQATCLWRRTLLACVDMNRVLAPMLAKRLGTEIAVAQGLMNRLEKEDFIKTAGKGKRLGKLVNKDKITTVGIPKYLKKVEKAESTGDECIKNTNATEMEKDEVEALAEQTEALNFNNNKKNNKLSRKKKKQQITEVRSSPRVADKGSVIPQVQAQSQDRGLKRRGRKRAVSKRDQDAEFEISNTQDVYEELPIKKKKTSVVGKDIYV